MRPGRTTSFSQSARRARRPLPRPSTRRRRGSTVAAEGPRSRGAAARFPGIRAACEGLPGANLAIVSVPGPFAAREARRALAAGLNVLVFSDNVPVEEEVALKREARARGLALMGPDCGTAIVAGTPLAFANRVRRGAIGVVAASGTGLQELSVLVHRGRRRPLPRDRGRGPGPRRRRGRARHVHGPRRPRSGPGHAARRHRLQAARPPDRGRTPRPPRGTARSR